MKRFLKKRFLGIPMLAILLVVLTSVTVLATITAIIRSNDVQVDVVVDDRPVYSLLLNEVGTVYVGESFVVTGQLTATYNGDVEGKTIMLYSASNTYTGVGSDALTDVDGYFSSSIYAGSVGPMTIHVEAPIQN